MHAVPWIIFENILSVNLEEAFSYWSFLGTIKWHSFAVIRRRSGRITSISKRFFHFAALSVRMTISLISIMNNNMKIAIVCDWLVTLGGAERFLGELIHCFPEADLFAVIDFIPNEHRAFLQNKLVKTTFLQHAPFVKKLYRSYLPLDRK